MSVFTFAVKQLGGGGTDHLGPVRKCMGFQSLRNYIIHNIDLEILLKLLIRRLVTLVVSLFKNIRERFFLLLAS